MHSLASLMKYFFNAIKQSGSFSYIYTKNNNFDI